jgi:hypothetical protein
MMFTNLCVSFGCLLFFFNVIIFFMVAIWYEYKFNNHLSFSLNAFAKVCLYNIGVGHPLNGALTCLSLFERYCFVIQIT